MDLRTGDLVKVEIIGPDDGRVRDAADRLTAELRPDLLRIEGQEPVPGEFNGAATIIEFLIGATAALSAEGIRAMIAAGWRKARHESSTGAVVTSGDTSASLSAASDDSSPAVPARDDAPEITVTTTAEGVVEVRVRLRK